MLKELNGNFISFCAVINYSFMVGTSSNFPKAGGLLNRFYREVPILNLSWGTDNPDQELSWFVSVTPGDSEML
jgi:hypothetical protein